MTLDLDKAVLTNPDIHVSAIVLIDKDMFEGRKGLGQAGGVMNNGPGP